VKRCLSKVGDQISVSWPADDTRLLPGQGHALVDGKNLEDMLQ
jgi:putative spermidine/putrescine transport system ATP-binding protein